MKYKSWTLCCAVAMSIATALVTGSAAAQTCGGLATTPAIYNQTFQIELQVDANRYVESAVYSNNRLGDYILEFTAIRTDIPNTRERWTVTFEKDATFDHHEQLHVDGNWIYSIKSRLVGGDRHVTIAAPGTSVEVNIADLSNDPGYNDFIALVTQTADHRAVVAAVAGEMELQAQQPAGPCGCGPAPDCSMDLPEPLCRQDCVDWFTCCWQNADYLDCLGACFCNGLPPAEIDECCAELAAASRLRRQRCIDAFLQCLAIADPCTSQQ
jgi:hypothetical protein